MFLIAWGGVEGAGGGRLRMGWQYWFIWRNKCYQMQQYRRCDLWHHMFTKEPQSLDFLQAWFVHTQWKNKFHEDQICLYKLLIWRKGHILKLARLFYFLTLEFMWKWWHKHVALLIWYSIACQKGYGMYMYKVTPFANKGYRSIKLVLLLIQYIKYAYFTISVWKS